MRVSLAGRRLLSVALLVLVVGAAPVAAKSAGGGWFRGLLSMFSSGDSFVSDPARAVRSSLTSNVGSQDAAVETIVEAVDMWAQDRKDGEHHPLVVAFSGTTGVGKTMSAGLMCKALLKEGSGFIELRGEDYADKTAQLRHFHDDVKSRLVKHVGKHPNGAVVLFDEAQKAVPGVLDVLLPALSMEQPHMTHKIKGEYRTETFENVVFIIISDIGVDSIQQLVVDNQGASAASFQNTLSKRIRKELHAHWDGIKIGGLIQRAVAFLPLEPAALQEVVCMHLRLLGKKKTGRWKEFTFTDDVCGMLTGSKYISYVKVKTDKGAKRFSKYGARDVTVAQSGPINSVKSVLFKTLGRDNPHRHVNLMVEDRQLVITSCDHENKQCAPLWKGTP